MTRLKDRVKFATQVDAELLEEIKALASAEGRQIQALVDEALEQLLKSRSRPRVRPVIMAAYKNSLKKYDDLYRELAK